MAHCLRYRDARSPGLAASPGRSGALIPALIADHANAQAGAVFRAQASAAAAVVAWRRGASPHAWNLPAARRKGGPRWKGWLRRARAPASPLATLRDTVRAERALHDVRAWAPVEDIARLAKSAGKNGQAEPAGRPPGGLGQDMGLHASWARGC